MVFFLQFLGATTACLLSAKLGLAFGQVQDNVTLMWPPAGVALALLWLGGLRFLPAVALGMWLTALMVDSPPVFALGSAVANTLSAWVAHRLLTRFVPVNRQLASVQDLLATVSLGGMVAGVVSATLGPVSLWATGLTPTAALPHLAWSWWRAHVLGVAFFTPLLLVFAKNRPYLSARITWQETAAVWLGALVAGQMVFLGWVPPGLTLERPPQLAWIFPFLLWAALRTGRRNTALVQMLFVSQALLSTHLHLGLFADDLHHFGLSNFWFSSLILSLFGMSLAIFVNERRHAMLQTALHAKVFSLSNDGVLIVDPAHTVVAINAAFTRLTGYAAAEVVGQPACYFAGNKEDPEFMANISRSLQLTGQWEGEGWNRRKSGELFLESLSLQTIFNAEGGVANHIGIFSDITESRAAQDAVVHQAQHDFLTGLPNRLLFSDRFGQQLALARRNDTKFGVIYLDLDGFKAVNDTHGHAAGDQLLVLVAQRLTHLVREIDTVSRLGGDEFAVLVSDVSQNSDVTTLADKILDVLSHPCELKNTTVSITASLGLAIFPFHGLDMEALINAADEALLQAKEEGKNAWQLSEVDWADSDQWREFRDSQSTL